MSTTFFGLVARPVDTLSMMVLSNVTRSSSHFGVVSRNLQFNRLSNISFLTASHLFLLSGLGEPVLKLGRLVDGRRHDVVCCSASLARSRSQMLLISAACAEILSDMFLWSYSLTIAYRASSLLFSAYPELFPVVRLLSLYAILGTTTLPLFRTPLLNNSLQVCSCRAYRCSQR